MYLVSYFCYNIITLFVYVLFKFNLKINKENIENIMHYKGHGNGLNSTCREIWSGSGKIFDHFIDLIVIFRFV